MFEDRLWKRIHITRVSAYLKSTGFADSLRALILHSRTKSQRRRVDILAKLHDECEECGAGPNAWWLKPMSSKDCLKRNLLFSRHTRVCTRESRLFHISEYLGAFAMSLCPTSWGQSWKRGSLVLTYSSIKIRITFGKATKGYFNLGNCRKLEGVAFESVRR